MKVKFCGAARTVTGSSHLLTLDDGYKILLDCGLFQGKGKNIWALNNKWYFDPKEIDCLVLSHAHIDHSGRVPQLVKDGFRGNIICTHATRSLCAIMLLDSAFIQERDVEYYNRKILKKRKRKNGVRVPLYTSRNVAEAMELFLGYGYNRWNAVHPGVRLRFSDAGHILGSSSVLLEITTENKITRIGFTGDIGRPNRPILRDPQPLPEVDYLISESTYGDKLHESPPQEFEKFLQIIQHTCLEKKGKLIIPAFSVGRTQEIVYLLDQLETAGRLPKIPIYVDSPLAVNATQVFGAHPECFDNELHEYLLIDENPFGFSDLRYIRDVAKSKELNTSNEPCVIISSSGMMNAGRVKHHLYNNIEDKKNTFLIVGYCSPDTPGGQLKGGATALRVFGDWKMVHADVEVMDSFSAHGDQKEMFEFIEPHKNSARKSFLVHGEYDTQLKFQSFLKNRGFNNVEIPQLGQEYNISE
jgi:metallo-beta-lactamase family protein